MQQHEPPASAGPRVSDEELAQMVGMCAFYEQHAPKEGFRNSQADLILDLRDERTALAAANARIAVLEAVDEEVWCVVYDSNPDNNSGEGNVMAGFFSTEELATKYAEHCAAQVPGSTTDHEWQSAWQVWRVPLNGFPAISYNQPEWHLVGTHLGMPEPEDAALATESQRRAEVTHE